MTVAKFFDKTVYIKRNKITSGYKSNFWATATADTSIQKLDAEAATSLGVVTGKSYYAYFEEDVDIQKGDILVDSLTGIRYEVKDLTKVSWGINKHQEVLVEELNA